MQAWSWPGSFSSRSRSSPAQRTLQGRARSNHAALALPRGQRTRAEKLRARPFRCSIGEKGECPHASAAGVSVLRSCKASARRWKSLCRRLGRESQGAPRPPGGPLPASARHNGQQTLRGRTATRAEEEESCPGCHAGTRQRAAPGAADAAFERGSNADPLIQYPFSLSHALGYSPPAHAWQGSRWSATATAACTPVSVPQ